MAQHFPEPVSSEPELVSRLRAAGSVFAEEEAELILEAARDPAELERMAAERVAGRPLEQVVGFAEFCGLRILLDPGVFVPRQRTRLMVEIAAGFLSAGDVAVDLGCGSGALAAAVAAWVPGLELYAADIDPAAVACARRNLPPERVFDGDLFAALAAVPDLRGRVRALLANAPYVPTDRIPGMPPEAREHEHHVALDGGPDGLDVHRRILADAPTWLAPGGWLLIEVASAQLDRAVALVTEVGLTPRVWTAEEYGGLVVGGQSSAG